MIRVDTIAFAYKKTPVLQDISFTVATGEILSILGPNGGGKSTLLKCLNHSLVPSSGRVYAGTKKLSELTRKEIARTIALVPQRAEVLFPFTVSETIEMGFYAHEQSGSTCIDEVLYEIGIPHLKNRSINELSGGELQLVFVARAMVQRPSVLLLDEATSNLDINHTAAMFKAIKKMVATQNTTVISVLHDINQASRFSDRILFLKNTIHTQPLPPEQAITPEIINSYYNISPDLIEFDTKNSTVHIQVG